ncbi:hypothetical protein ROHU_016136 [Labeo rohita]|uniref:Uncharacterized protein n=1 Tax=Labeo rohita TaxID=84645 RepID=A0A498NLN2_LABRO|nr:hypothetical protein ROHU_016136 [Labeo rohita]
MIWSCFLMRVFDSRHFHSLGLWEEPLYFRLARVTARALLRRDRTILRWQFVGLRGLTDVRRVMDSNHETCNTDQTCPLVRCSETSCLVMSGLL